MFDAVSAFTRGKREPRRTRRTRSGVDLLPHPFSRDRRERFGARRVLCLPPEGNHKGTKTQRVWDRGAAADPHRRLRLRNHSSGKGLGSWSGVDQPTTPPRTPDLLFVPFPPPKRTRTACKHAISFASFVVHFRRQAEPTPHEKALPPVAAKRAASRTHAGRAKRPSSLLPFCEPNPRRSAPKRRPRPKPPLCPSSPWWFPKRQAGPTSKRSLRPAAKRAGWVRP